MYDRQCVVDAGGTADEYDAWLWSDPARERALRMALEVG